MSSHKFCTDNAEAFQFKLVTFYNTVTEKQNFLHDKPLEIIYK